MISSAQSYQEANRNSIDRWFDLFLLALLIVPTGVVLGILYLLFRCANKRHIPFIYRGHRLGLGRTSFIIYKVRTLKPGSDRLLNGIVLPIASDMELPFGDFLRNSRLDELPQLYNILKGDMSFFGPRPVREDVYVKTNGEVPGYKKRFTVRPGFLGPAQILLPHSSDKKLRARINKRYFSLENKFFYHFKLLLFAFQTLFKNLAYESGAFARRFLALVLSTRRLTDRRKTDRMINRNGKLSVNAVDANSGKQIILHINDISAKAIQVRSPMTLRAGQALAIELTVCYKRLKKRKVVRCAGIVDYCLKSRPGDNASSDAFRRYVVSLQPSSPLNHYLFDQYILRRSIFMRSAR